MSIAKDLARALRRVPPARRILEAGDPRRRAVRLDAAGIIDPALYSAQSGEQIESSAETAHHYTTVGFHEGATVNVLIEPDLLDKRLMITGRPIIYDYVNSRAWSVPVSGWWDSPAYLAENPESGAHPGGPAGHLWDRLSKGDTSSLLIDGEPVSPAQWTKIYETLTEASAEWSTFSADRLARRPEKDLRHSPTLSERFPEDHPRPLISVVLPVWNRPAGLRAAFGSLLKQSWNDWELVVVDDGSWDDTLAVLEVLERTDARVRVVRRSHEGVCAARNAGIAAAAGEYVAFLDSDNAWHPRFLEDMMTALVPSDAEAGYATIASRSEEGVVYRQRPTTYRRLLTGNTVDLNVLVVSRDALIEAGAFDESLRRAVDYDLILRLAERRPLLHVETVGAEYDNDSSAGDRISTTEPLGWNILVRLRHLVGAAPAPDLSPGTTYLVCIAGWDPDFDAKLDAITELVKSEETEVILVLTEPKSSEWRRARLRAMGRSIQPILLGWGPLSLLVDAAVPRARHDRMVIVGPDAQFDADTLSALATEVDAGRARAVIPLSIQQEGTLAGVGAARIRASALPLRILAGHPREDAQGLPVHQPVPALTGMVVALPTEHVRRVGGLDPLLYHGLELEGLSARLRSVDPNYTFDVLTAVPLSLTTRLARRRHVDVDGNIGVILRTFEGVPADDVTPIYATAGFRLTGVTSIPRPEADPADDVEPPEIPERTYLRAVVTRDQHESVVAGERVPRLRWALKTASPAGTKGERWGDTHFARSLAAALRKLGQDVVVDAREAQHRDTGYLDDVVVVLRGLDEIEPDRSALSYLWVISHPDMVTRREASRYDRVFAASAYWSKQISERWSLPVEPLLQCTDPTRFSPPGAARGSEILFVGNSRGVPRPTVMEAVRSGVDVKIYGGDWERFLPEGSVTAPGVDNAQLGAMYGSASVVLNDHWSDMQREGFISNRLFDVVAAGGRVLSDDVAGLRDIFEGAVHTFSSVSEIGPLLRGDLDALFDNDDQIARISERIRSEHSFLARAQVLLDHAREDLDRAGS